jgi:hypothetical protein
MGLLRSEIFFEMAKKDLFEDRSVLTVLEDLKENFDNTNFEK